VIAAAIHRARLQKLGSGGVFPAELTIRLVFQDEEHEVRLFAGELDTIIATLEDKRYVVRVLDSGRENRDLRVEIDGHSHAYTVFSNHAEVYIHSTGLGSHSMGILSRFARHSSSVHAGGYVASLPGLVLEVLVKDGHMVKAGETIIVLESMKMEHRVLAAEDGVVKNLAVQAGDVVEKNARLVEVVQHEQETE